MLLSEFEHEGCSKISIYKTFFRKEKDLFKSVN